MKEMNTSALTEVMKEMKPNSIGLLFSGKQVAMSWDIDYPFFPNRNFLYLTGWENSNAALLITKTDGDADVRLFIARQNEHMRMHFGNQPSEDEAAAVTGIKQISFIDDLEWYVSRALRRSIDDVYMDFTNRGLASDGKAIEWAQLIKERVPYVNIKSISPIIAKNRRIKTDDEIALITKAIDITAKGLEAMTKEVAPGRYEYEMEAYFNFGTALAGGRGFAFPSIIASGKNSALIHYSGKNGRLEDDSLLLVDVGAEYGFYASDISRTYPVSGKFNPLQDYFYNAVLESQQYLIEDYLRPQADHKATLDAARGVLAPFLTKKGLITLKNEAAKYLPHGVCHFMGLDAHDPGDMDVLEPGMVITCEPGVYFPEYGFGIRIEDDILITQDSCRVLSAHIPKVRG